MDFRAVENKILQDARLDPMSFVGQSLSGFETSDKIIDRLKRSIGDNVESIKPIEDLLQLVAKSHESSPGKTSQVAADVVAIHLHASEMRDPQERNIYIAQSYNDIATNYEIPNAELKSIGIGHDYQDVPGNISVVAKQSDEQLRELAEKLKIPIPSKSSVSERSS